METTTSTVLTGPSSDKPASRRDGVPRPGPVPPGRALFELWGDAMAWQRIVDDELRDVGLNHTQLLVLQTIALLEDDLGDLPDFRQIEIFARLTQATASRVAAKLVRMGLIDRGLGAGSAIWWRFHVTPAGRAKLGATAPLIRRAVARFERDRACTLDRRDAEMQDVRTELLDF